MKHHAVLLLAAVLVACGPSGGGPTDGGNPGDGADGTPRPDSTPKPDGIQGCNPESFTLQQSPPAEVYLVIDRSGSMAEPGSAPPQTKWQELNAAVDLVLTQFQNAIMFGVLTYPANTECNTSGPQVRFALGNRVPIINHLASQTPAGGTPTAAALNNAFSSLTDLGTPGSQKFVVLATDGGPNCNYFLSADPSCSCGLSSSQYCCTSYPQVCYFPETCLDDAHVLQVISDLHTQGVDTFVIGLTGSGQYAELLNQMAIAGGRPQAGATSYYPASSQAEIADALQVIANSVITCQIDLQQAPDQPDEVHVYIDGTPIPRDPTHVQGWDYTDDTHTRIELTGGFCDTLQDGQSHDVVATFACVVN